METSRAVQAFLLAPLPFPLFFFFAGLLVGDGYSGFWIFVITLVFAYLIMTVFGVPAHSILQNMKFDKSYHYAFVGFVISVFPFSIIFLAPRFVDIGGGWSEFVRIWSLTRQVIFVSVGCTITALIFWAIARPDLR